MFEVNDLTGNFFAEQIQTIQIRLDLLKLRLEDPDLQLYRQGIINLWVILFH